VHRVCYIYKCLQIINIEFNYCFSDITVPVIMYMTLFSIVFCNNALIRFHRNMQIPVLGLVTLCTVVIFLVIHLLCPFGSRVYTKSKGFTESYKSCNYRPIINKTQLKTFKSLTPMKVQVGSTLYMNRSATLSIFSAVFYLTCKLIIA